MWISRSMVFWHDVYHISMCNILLQLKGACLFLAFLWEPLPIFWYGWLDRHYLGTALRTFVKKMAMDTVLGVPITNISWFFCKFLMFSCIRSCVLMQNRFLTIHVFFSRLFSSNWDFGGYECKGQCMYTVQ